MILAHIRLQQSWCKSPSYYSFYFIDAEDGLWDTERFPGHLQDTIKLQFHLEVERISREKHSPGYDFKVEV